MDEDTKDIISKLLVKNPEDRLGGGTPGSNSYPAQTPFLFGRF